MRALTAYFGSAVALLALDAGAAPGGASVATDGCAVDDKRLERLVGLELASVVDASAEPASYVITIRCESGRATIVLADPLTSKRLERDVVAPSDDAPEPERLMALAVAQLYRASWLELLTPDDPPLPPVVPPSGSPREVASARKLAEPALAADGSPTRDRHRASLAIAAGGRVRGLAAPTALPAVELQASWAPTGELFSLLLSTGVEAAAVTRDVGELDIVLARVALGLTVEPLVAGPWSGFGEISGGVAVLRVAPSDVAPDRDTTSFVAPGFDGSIGLGAAARVEPISFELVGRVGLLHGTPTAIVAGDDDVSLDGAYVGADFRLRWLL